MEKKKILKITLIIILVLIALFLAITIRKMIIIKNLNQKVANYKNDDNHYEKIINDSASTTTVTEYYYKGDNAVTFLTTRIKSTGQIRKLVNYYKGENTNTYIESDGNKVALLDSNALPSKITIMDVDYSNSLWQLFQVAMATSIKTGEYNGKEYYILSLGKTSERYIEKETGLTVKAKDGIAVDNNRNEEAIIVEYYYEFGNVDDSIFIEPDISQYTLQENN